jgi:hypothetical protein
MCYIWTEVKVLTAKSLLCIFVFGVPKIISEVSNFGSESSSGAGKAGAYSDVFYWQ